MNSSEFAPDNVDRMLLQVVEETFAAQPWRRDAPLVVVNDVTGALSDWARTQRMPVRFLQDSAAAARAHAELTGPVATAPSREVFTNAATVLYRLARPLEALEELAWHVARWASEDVVLLAGQLQRHLNFSMNGVLEQSFEEVSASRGYYKSRALRARTPKPLHGDTPPRIPRKNVVQVVGADLHLRAYGLTFGAARLDPGTKLLLETLIADADFPAAATVVDLGCGNGTVAAVLAHRFAPAQVIATDDSASAVESTRQTLRANGVADVEVMHQSGLVDMPDCSVDAVVLNPPFHRGTEITSDVAFHLFDEAARVLKPGGVLWAVSNVSRQYRPHLTHRVGPTWQLARDQRFIVTQSRKDEAYE